MSLDITARRKAKIKEENRKLRNLGLVILTEPGPVFAIPENLQFDPAFFPGLMEQKTAIDTAPAK